MGADGIEPPKPKHVVYSHVDLTSRPRSRMKLKVQLPLPSDEGFEGARPGDPEELRERTRARPGYAVGLLTSLPEALSGVKSFRS